MSGTDAFAAIPRLREICRSGMNTLEYLGLLEDESRRIPTIDMDARSRNRMARLPINQQRTARILRTHSVPDDLRSRIGALTVPQFWMILTEPWCADSAQCIPYFVKFAECNERIQLCFLLRDQNPTVMDRYLTDGSRGIPKIVAFNVHGNEIFRWGPRPREGQELFQKGKAEGLPKEQTLERLHLWYGRNRGEAITAEFEALLNSPGLHPDSQPDLPIAPQAFD